MSGNQASNVTVRKFHITIIVTKMITIISIITVLLKCAENVFILVSQATKTLKICKNLNVFFNAKVQLPSNIPMYSSYKT